MIAGVGTDIVQVARIEQSVEQFGDDFALRILCDEEYIEYQQSKKQAHFLAKRFAIKEAASKALGTGFRQGLSWQHICVTHTSLGAPQLLFYHKAAERALDLSITANHVSVADERDYVVAFVVLEA